MSKKFLLIGHSVLDTIINGKSKVIRPGGIFYSTIALLNIISKVDEITLITNYDASSFHYFADVYEHVELKFSSKVDLIPRIKLTIYPDKERKEKYSNFDQNLKIDGQIDFSVYDLILVNMITGFELNAQTLSAIKSKTEALIYFDVHSLSRGIDDKNVRFQRKIPDRGEWLKSIDILQANEYEILSLSEETDEMKIAREILSTGVKILLITKSNKGAVAYFCSDNKLESISLKAIKINSTNFVGCGDVFGTVFSYYYSKTSDIKFSLTLANKASGVITSYNKIQDYKNLPKDLERNYA